VLALLAVVWALAWAIMGASALVGPAAAAVLLVLSLAVFGLGETLLSPVAPAITNDLATDRLRGRYNATASLAFQVGAITAPIAAGLLLGARRPAEFVALLLVGCAALAAVALRLERHLPPAANGIRPPVAAGVTASAGDPLPGGAGHARS
jgi:MFS family permease